MQMISDYMGSAELRHKLNELTRKIFGFDFEAWVTGGYWNGDYIPYSLLDGDKMISNASANRMSFLQNGVKKKYIQIGTVMTDEARRHEGLARKLMEHIIKEFKDECDGFYLFGDLDALGFYEKLGFKACSQYVYRLKKAVTLCSEAAFEPVDKGNAEIKAKYMEYVRGSAVNSALEQTNKIGLQMFYTAGMDNVYYAEDIDCFIVLDDEDGNVVLQSVICRERISLETVLSRIKGCDIGLRLGFAPLRTDAELFDAVPYDGGSDYRLMCYGGDFSGLEQDKLYFPELSHA